jgi:hypothetical protein
MIFADEYSQEEDDDEYRNRQYLLLLPPHSPSPSPSFSVFVTVSLSVCVLGFNKNGFILRVFQWLAWWSTVQSLKFFACRRGFILQDSLVQDVLLGTN